MTEAESHGGQRYDRALRVVMWLDAFWSVAAVVIAALGAPAILLLGLPDRVVSAVGLAAIGSGLLLAACGAITGALLMARLNAGVYTMPRMRVPLPPGMHGDIG